MTPYHQDAQFTLHRGDCRAVLAAMEPNSVDLCVTSPPYYGLRRYSGDQDGTWGGIELSQDYCAMAVRRVTALPVPMVFA